MKEFENDMDQLFRKSLEDYKITPDKSRKEKFIAAGKEIFASKKQRFSSGELLAVLAFITIGLAAIIFYSLINESYLNSEETTLTDAKKEILTDGNKTLDSYHPVEYDSEYKEVPNKDESLSQISSSISSPSESNKEMKRVAGDNAINDNGFSQPKITNNVDNASHRTLYLNRTISALKPLSLQRIPSLTLETAMNPLFSPDTFDEKTEDIQKKPSENDATIKVAYSFNYSPQYIFNIIENNKLLNNFGIDINFKLFNNKYIIRTGVGASISKGYYEYAIDYNEYLGSYQGLDSISFAWDDKHYFLLPTYHTTEREVFDTAIQTTISNVYKRFTYLQFPFVLGYNFMTNEKFSLGLRFGPTLSLLLKSKTLSEDYNPEKNQVLQINQITPDRISTNWLLMAGMNMSLNTKQNVYFEIEPQFTYYFNSVYEKKDISKPPFGIGCRLAIGIK